MYKVTREGYSIALCSIVFVDPKISTNKKNHRSSLSRPRDRKGHVQGHVTLMYKVTRKGYSIALCSIVFVDPKKPRNKKKFIVLACLDPEIGKVTFKVT